MTGVQTCALPILSFNPRYRDFPFAPLTAAALPFLLLRMIAPRAAGDRPLSETLAAPVLALCAVFIVWNETLANWQALWFCAGLFGLAVFFYLYDSTVLLYSNEAVLACDSRRRWSAATGMAGFLLAGRTLCLLNPFTPHWPSFRLRWDYHSLAQTPPSQWM